MLQPLFFETDTYLLHSFRAQDVDRIEAMRKDIYDILSDEQTLTFIPEKRIKTLNQAESFLVASIINYHAQRNYLHFVTNKQFGQVIGMIDLISPEFAREHYQIDQYPHFIEFYLNPQAIGKGIMSSLLPTFIKQLSDQGIFTLGAVTNRNNFAALKILQKANFQFKQQFDLLQDLYHFTY